MALWLQKDQRVKVQKLTVNDNFSVANLSSSRKNNKDEGKYLYSDWGFSKFVGKAHEFVSENVSDGDILVVKSAMMTKESYMDKNGQKAYPKSAQLVIFDCELYKTGSGGNSKPAEEVVPNDDDIPF